MQVSEVESALALTRSCENVAYILLNISLPAAKHSCLLHCTRGCCSSGLPGSFGKALAETMEALLANVGCQPPGAEAAQHFACDHSFYTEINPGPCRDFVPYTSAESLSVWGDNDLPS